MSKEAINELKRLRSILSGITGLEDDDQEYIEDARKSVDRIIEALAEQPAPVQGWKLVPIEPTEDMWKAVNKLDDEMAAGSYDGKGCSIEQAWNCLLAAAPKPAQQEPVVWMYVNKSTHETKFQKHMRDFIDHSLWSEVPLYGEPLANHELQCICGAIWLGDEMVHLPDKRLPPQRTWVGLTDGEIVDLCDGRLTTWGQVSTARAIEAKLKEKNT